MKAIKDCELKIKIITFTNFDKTKDYWWYTYGKSFGIDGCLESKTFKAKQKAIDNFKEFAKLNGIENYSIKE